MNIPWNAHTYDCNRPWTIAACAKKVVGVKAIAFYVTSW